MIIIYYARAFVSTAPYVNYVQMNDWIINTFFKLMAVKSNVVFILIIQMFKGNE